MIWNPFLRKKPDRSETLYGAIVAAARQPIFYREWGIADTVEGRFEMVVLHLSLVIIRLKGEHDDLRQALANRFCLDMDDNLRELGVGDLGVAKRVRAMAEAFQGRYVAYEAAHDEAQMAKAIARNVYAGKAPSNTLALYALRAKVVLGGESASDILNAKVLFQ